MASLIWEVILTVIKSQGLKILVKKQNKNKIIMESLNLYGSFRAKFKFIHIFPRSSNVSDQPESVCFRSYIQLLRFLMRTK